MRRLSCSCRKDLRFNRAAARHRLVDQGILMERLDTMYLGEALETEIRSRIALDFDVLLPPA